MATQTSRPELWKFCTACDPHQERPFSVERAYIKHLSSQRHLRRTNQPLDTFDCPDCGKNFSRESEIHRHLTNGRCSGTPGSRLISRPTTTSSKKHVLSVSPNGAPWKSRRTDAFTMEATVGSPPLFASRPTCRHNADRVIQAHSSLDTKTIVNRPPERLIEDELPPRRTIAQVDRTTSLTTLLLHDRRQHGNVQSLALSPTCPQESTNADTQTLSALTDVGETEPLVFGSHDADDTAREKTTSASEEVKPADKPSASTISDKEVDRWLSDAMKSASLKEDDLAHVQVHSVILSTPAESLGSLGSLFLLRTPKVLTPRFSFPSPRFSKTVIKSFARSADMPAPMLTELIGSDHLMSETSPISAVICPGLPTQGVPIVRPENVNRAPYLSRTSPPKSDSSRENIEPFPAPSYRPFRWSLPSSLTKVAKTMVDNTMAVDTMAVDTMAAGMKGVSTVAIDTMAAEKLWTMMETEPPVPNHPVSNSGTFPPHFSLRTRDTVFES
jgi:hypothetical protein